MRTANDPHGSNIGVKRGGDAAPLPWRIVILRLVGITAVLAVTGVALNRETGLAPFLVFLPTLIAARGTVRQTRS